MPHRLDKLPKEREYTIGTRLKYCSHAQINSCN